MNAAAAAALEAFLARLYTDARLRRLVRADPHGTAVREGLSPEALADINWVDLEAVAESFEKKRRRRGRRWFRR